MVKWLLKQDGVDVNHIRKQCGAEGNHSPLIVAGINGNIEVSSFLPFLPFAFFLLLLHRESCLTDTRSYISLWMLGQR